MQRVIQTFVYLDDLANIIYKMIYRRSLYHNPDTPLEFIDFELLPSHLQYVVCMKNKHINKQFVLNNMNNILTRSWYCIAHRKIIDLEIFNLLSKDIKYYLVSNNKTVHLDLPKKILIDYSHTYEFHWIAVYPMTEDEIEYILLRHCPEEYVSELYQSLAEHQRLTQHHLCIMKRYHPKAALELVDNYY
jgi:hypothetical protein